MAHTSGEAYYDTMKLITNTLLDMPNATSNDDQAQRYYDMVKAIKGVMEDCPEPTSTIGELTPPL